MISVQEVLGTLSCDRESFANAFEKAQQKIGIVPPAAFEGLVVEQPEPLGYALSYSEQKGFFIPLVELIIQQQLDNGSLFALLMEKKLDADHQDAGLEAMVNVVQGFEHPVEMRRGMSKCMSITARVLIDNEPMGSGVLIGPDMVLTSWHVVQSLFTQSEGLWEVAPDNADRISIEFEDFIVPANHHRYKVVKEWCISHSNCHSNELTHLLPDNLEELDGHWDYALIKLDDTPGYERNWEKIGRPAPVPEPAQKLFVFQHPAGRGLKLASDVIVRPNPDFPGAIPSLRFVHGVNTLPGSSGGPCFNSSFELFGIHQGAYSRGDQKLNRGIPVGKIVGHLHGRGLDLTSHALPAKPMWRIAGNPKFIPVIGCEEFSKGLLKLIEEGKSRIIVMSGQEGTGKSFRLLVLEAMLPPSSNTCIQISGQSMAKMGALELAKLIAGKIGAEQTEFTPMDQANTTASAWVKNSLVPELIQKLQENRNGKAVWIIFSDLNRATIDEDLTSDFLFTLYEQYLYHDWLRFVLDGLRIGLPEILGDVKYFPSEQPTLRSIENFYSRFFTELKIPLGPETIEFLTRASLETYRTANDKNPQTAFSKLVENVKGSLISYIPQLENPAV